MSSLKYLINKTFIEYRLTNKPIHKKMLIEMNCMGVYPRYHIITHKDKLYQYLKKEKFMPESYIIRDFKDMKNAAKDKMDSEDLWFFKLSRVDIKKGIVVGNMRELTNMYPNYMKKQIKQNSVLQREIKSYLVEGKKIVLRVFMLLVHDKFYFYKEGKIGFSKKYDQNNRNLYTHVTKLNSAVKKPNYNGDDTWSKHNLIYKNTFHQVKNIAKTISRVYQSNYKNHKKVILFGLDILVDPQLRCYLAEVNSRPGIYPKDKQFYYGLAKDVVNIYLNQNIPKSKRPNKWIRV